MTDATTAVAGEYLWSIRYALLAVAAFCLLKAFLAAHAAFFLWEQKKKGFRFDPEIEEGMKDVKRRSSSWYSWIAAGWLLCAGLLVYVAFVAIM
ncbi:hypothetical protein EJP67_32965 [Variovorax guangxiensis]|uniref:Uncharacterized protein n=1 Tax=Variovorax guangxiensis TaxID=1775474 RepID=A0A433MVQ5_9BURK|nr:hypothetical protein [Variovorax guangxiensis]RUR71869.1 hypothetical protein EJP67_32965 [Variovorax guangxiensis]